MKNKNVYKPRYKIAFKAKKKNWIYKNCRMRRFFNLRGRKIQRRGYFKRIVLVLNNIKWTVARRYIRPYRHKRRPGLNKKRYSLRFYTKQLVRNFYGKIKESSFQQFLRSYLLSVKKRNNSFFAALECRLDMVVFRMRFLPTIFACNQLIHHYGICVNRQIERTPQSLVKIGDTITLAKSHWEPVFLYLNRLVVYRVYAAYIAGRREYRLHLKKVWWLKKKRYFKRKSFSLLRKKFKVFSYIKYLKRDLKRYNYLFKGGLSQHFMSMKRRKGQRYFNHSLEEVENEEKESMEILDVKKTKEINEINYLKKLVNTEVANKRAVETTKRISVLFKKIFKIFRRSKKILRRIFKKRNKKRKVFQRKWRWKKHYSFFFKMMSFNFNFLKSINYLWMRLRLEEVRSHRNVLVNLYIKRSTPDSVINKYYEIQDMKKYNIFIKMLWEEEKLILKESKYYSRSLMLQYKYVLKKKIKRSFRKKYKQRARFRMFKFLSKRKRKKRRARSSKRLRGYHWYIPKYLEFNWKTMTGMLITSPKNKEIYLPFRCTLRQIYSFYRSRGY